MNFFCYAADGASDDTLAEISGYGISIYDHPPSDGLYLYTDSEGIRLCKAGEKGSVRVDFVGGGAQYRRLKGGGELIVKAVNHTVCPSVIDATGGLGRDAFVLAAQGLPVSIIERHPVVACLLSDGLRRARAAEETSAIAKRMTLHYGDAVRLLSDLAAAGRPDVVYLDPMYPERQKSAAVKKEMAYFHQLIGSAQNTDDAELLAAARDVATKRIVVKRPRLGALLAQCTPAYQYSGKSTRFDIYLPTRPNFGE